MINEMSSYASGKDSGGGTPYKLLVFGHHSLIKNIKQSAVIRILNICIL